MLAALVSDISNYANSIIRVIAYRQHIVAPFIYTNSFVNAPILYIDVIEITIWCN